MKSILTFELAHYTKRLGFYTLLLVFLGFGFIIATKARVMEAPNMFKNAPYIAAYLIGLMSLVCIFISTLLAVQVWFREKDAQFNLILYTTPLSKKDYLGSRFIVVFGLTVVLFFCFVLGLMLGHQMPWLDRGGYSPLNVWHYIQPFLLLAVPNALFCAAMVSIVAWRTQNKLLVYITGLFIYIGYMATLIFSGSPLMAGGFPPSAMAMDLSAKFDPFGLSAFFQQTQHWTGIEKNTQLLSLSGNFGFNRLFYFGVSALTLGIGFLRFRFPIEEKRKKTKILDVEETAPLSTYKPVKTVVFTAKHYVQSLLSFVKMDLKYVVKSIPFLLILAGIGFYISMEIYGYIDRGIRLPENYASSGLMVNTILKQLPPLCLFVLLFYGNELFWRSRNVYFDLIEQSTPLSISTHFFAKWLAQTVIIGLLITWIIAIALIFQVLYQYTTIEWGLYARLYYLVGLPLVVLSGVILCVQSLIPNKYLGLIIATILTFLMATSMGKWAGFTHPLFRFCSPYAGVYSDMNGFGMYISPFNWKMLFGCTFTFLLALCIVNGQQLKNAFSPASHNFPKVFNFWKVIPPLKILTLLVFVLLGLTTLLSGFFITKNFVIKDKNAEFDWQQNYEQKYRKYQNLPQPSVTEVKTVIDLMPENNAYRVTGTYKIQNKTTKNIDSVLIYMDEEMMGDNGKLVLTNADMLSKDAKYGHYWIRFAKYLMPNESRFLEFSFSFKQSSFKQHEAFNAIVENGSFMRLSNYFPKFGYQSSLEIEDEKERKARNLGKKTPLLTLSDPLSTEADFIHLDMTISTSTNQIAIGVGELVNTWTHAGRQYFHYKTPSPIPFRFGVSSAVYAVQKAVHNGKNIEVFYHPQHFENVQHLIENAKKTLDYCTTNFGEYPYSTIRFAEISAFTRGFAATAYPSTIFMTEDMIFHANIKGDKQQDVINELAGHELAHEWWGAHQLVPDAREGAKFLTETLAMYTELMLVKQMYGQERVLENVNLHKDMYLNERGYTEEQPLYKTVPDNTHQHYSKGLVTMYQLTVLIGEEKINKALKNLLTKHAYPKPTPIATDFLTELYAVSDTSDHSKIDDLFKRIVTFEFKVKSAILKKTNHPYMLHLDMDVFKFQEDGNGRQTRVDFNGFIEIAYYFEEHTIQIVKTPVVNNQVSLQHFFEDKHKPVKMRLDPNVLLLGLGGEDVVF
jgi:ABC-2 type transport system permease protein